MTRILFAVLACVFSLSVYAADPLPPQQAFRINAEAVDDAHVAISFDIQPGYYLYRDKFLFTAAAPAQAPGVPQYPAGESHTDAFFGTQTVFRGALRIVLPISAPLNTPFGLTVTYQGCADIGVCYPPTKAPLSLKLVGMSVAPGMTLGGSGSGLRTQLGTQQSSAGEGLMDRPATSAMPAVMATVPALALDEDESASVAGLLAQGDLWLGVLSFFGFGLLLSFTPCVLPMVPILSGIIVGHGDGITRGRALLLSLAYVIGMAATYAIAGVLAGLSGTLLASVLQNAWVLGSFAAVFVVLALGMFGVYTLQLPAALQGRLGALAGQQGGSLPGLAVMGALSALIVGPCVAAPLAGALLYIAQTGNAVLGGSALFVMALGMGLPLIVVAVAARHWLPKTGAWMDDVKRFFGVLLLATALWLVSPVLPPMLVLLSWAALVLLCAVYLWVVSAKLLPRAFSVALLALAALLLAGATAGARDPLEAWTALRGGVELGHAQPFERIRSVAELDARLASATKPVMLDFYADWCVSCKEMERFTFTDPAVAQRMAGFTLLQADVTANNDEDQALLKRFGLFGPPGIIFFDPQGQELRGVRVVGYVKAERFAALLDKVSGAITAVK